MVTVSSSGGTGSSLARAVVIVAGVSSLVASLLSFVSIWLQTKNYRMPLLQRYVVRILLMVPIYAASSWASIISLKASLWLAPLRDIYEAFTIYTFFQLLINYLGGERAVIIMLHGRAPVQHAWPLNHFLSKVDLSDPHTFLAVKRGILQYAWLKPILAVLSIIMKATDIYKEGYLGLSSGYLWTGIVYNISVTISLYSLAMFWVCLHNDLAPFRPVPKFLCVKLIIFASYWQGFFLSILQWLGALSNGVGDYTPDNLAAAIQDSLICFEMPLFAMAHWYGFSWHDYANPTVSAARMPVKYALRDAFGVRDLVEDSKLTWRGDNYEYRYFDSGDHIIPHAESNSRVKRVMHGMRYERGGKAKYWIPKPGEANSRTPLLAGSEGSSRTRRSSNLDQYRSHDGLEEMDLDDDDEGLFTKARELEFGDFNYPVITANIVAKDQQLSSPPIHSTPQQSHLVKKAKKSRKIRASTGDSSTTRSSRKERSESSDDKQQKPSPSTSQSSRDSQLVDLVVENKKAEDEEREQLQRVYGSSAVEPEHKHFQRPSGEPIGEPAATNHLENDNPDTTTNEQAELLQPTRDVEDEPPRTSSWNYGELEEDNVWGR